MKLSELGICLCLKENWTQGGGVDKLHLLIYRYVFFYILEALMWSGQFHVEEVRVIFA